MRELIKKIYIICGIKYKNVEEPIEEYLFFNDEWIEYDFCRNFDLADKLNSFEHAQRYWKHVLRDKDHIGFIKKEYSKFYIKEITIECTETQQII